MYIQPRPARVIPAEFRGLARLLRQEVVKADLEANAALLAVVAPLKARLRRKPTLRPEHMLEAAATWRKLMPSRFRLLANTPEQHKNRKLVLSEWGIHAVEWREESWDLEAWEPGVGIEKLELRVEHGGLHLSYEPLATLSAHALARRFERGEDRRQEAVIWDLLHLPLGEWLPDRIVTPAGIWRGGHKKLMDTHSGTLKGTRSIRTFTIEDVN